MWAAMALTAVKTVLSVAGHIRQGRQAKQIGEQKWHASRIEGDKQFAAMAEQGRMAYKEGELEQSAALVRGAKAGLGSSEHYANLLAMLGNNAKAESQAKIFQGKQARQAAFYQGDLDYWKGSQEKKASQANALMSAVEGAASMASIYAGGQTPGGTKVTGSPTSQAAGIKGGWTPDKPGADVGYW